MLGKLLKRSSDEKNSAFFSHVTSAQDTIENTAIVELYQRWFRKDDSDGKRLVMKIIGLHTKQDVFVEAILADNLMSFKQAVAKKEPTSFLGFFEYACLCKARNIALYLVDYVDVLQSKYAVAYALSTGKKEFAFEIATMIKSRGQKEEPRGIHLFSNCTYSDTKEIAQLFVEADEVASIAHKPNSKK